MTVTSQQAATPSTDSAHPTSSTNQVVTQFVASMNAILTLDEPYSEDDGEEDEVNESDEDEENAETDGETDDVALTPPHRSANARFDQCRKARFPKTAGPGAPPPTFFKQSHPPPSQPPKPETHQKEFDWTEDIFQMACLQAPLAGPIKAKKAPKDTKNVADKGAMEAKVGLKGRVPVEKTEHDQPDLNETKEVALVGKKSADRVQ